MEQLKRAFLRSGDEAHAIQEAARIASHLADGDALSVALRKEDVATSCGIPLMTLITTPTPAPDPPASTSPYIGKSALARHLGLPRRALDDWLQRECRTVAS